MEQGTEDTMFVLIANIHMHYTNFKYGSFLIGISVVWWWKSECLPQRAYITHKPGSSMKGRYKYEEGKITSYNFMLCMLIVCTIYIVCSLMLLIVTINIIVSHGILSSTQALAMFEYHV